MQPSQLSYLAAQRQELAVDDERKRQRPVAGRVEKHRYLIAVVALYRALPPVRALNSRADRKRPVCC